MTLSSVKIADLVEIDKKGRRFIARVIGFDAPKGKAVGLRLKPICKNITWTTATAREVIGIWHANKQTAARYAP